MRAALLVLVLGGTASVAALQRAGELMPTRPENVWPTSVAGWLGLVLAGAACWGLWRKRESETMAPVLEKMDQVEAGFANKLAAERTHFDGEIRRLGEHYDERLDGMKLHHKDSLDAFRGAVGEQVNGWGKRVERVERGQEAMAEFNESVVRFMGQSETHRASLEGQIKSHASTTERRLELIDQKMDRILDALVQLKGGRNQ